MLTRIFAEFPFALKKNGILYGCAKNGVVKLDLDIDNPEFLEVIPLKQNLFTTSFLFDRDFLSTADTNISKTDLNGAYFIKIYPLYILTEQEKIMENKNQHGIISVYGDNLKVLNITTRYDTYTETIKGLGNIKCDFFTYSGQPFAYFFHNGTLNIYSLAEQIKKTLCAPCDEFYFKDSLITVKTFNDIAKHKVTSYYSCNGNEFKFLEKKVETSPYYSANALNKKVLPVAFFEGVLCGEDVSPYLTETLLDKQSKLQGYLGDFIGVLPAPEFRSIDETGLIYQKAQNLFQVKYCKTELKDRRICNLKLLD